MLPKQLSTGQRYMSASQRNVLVTIVQPYSGQTADGTQLPEVVIANTWANVAQWRNREVEKAQTRSGQSSYKITVLYPKSYSLDASMNIMVRGQRHLIESFSDPDGQRVELCIWTWVENDNIVSQTPSTDWGGTTGTSDGGGW